MLGVFFGVLSLVLAVSGGFCVSEARSYTDEQRARAPRLWKAYVASGVILCLVGVGTLAWLLGGSAAVTVSVIASVAALPCLVQVRFHRTAEIDRSPAAARLTEGVARKLNVPEANRQA